MYALFQTGGDLLYLFGGLFGSKDNGDDGAGLLRLCGLYGCLLRFGCVHIGFVLFAARPLRVTHNAVFFGYIAFAPVVPLGKGILVVVDIPLFGKSALVVDNCVPPVFLIHEISGTWTLEQYEGQYRAAMYAAVKSANPNWKPGQKFDTSILDNVTRESVESTLVKNGNRLVRNSIDVSV